MLACVLIALAFISCDCGKNPAIQVILTNKGLQSGRHVAAGWIQEKLDHVTLPDISGEIRVGFLLHIGYKLTGITIIKSDFPEPSVEFYQGFSGLKTSIEGLNVALTGSWEAHCGFVHGGGSFDMALFGVDVVSIVQLGRDAGGRLSLTSVNCNAQLGDLNTHFYVNFQVNQDLTLDLPLIGPPVVSASSLQLGLKGQFYSVKCPKEPPFVAMPFATPEQPAYMLSVGLSDFTVNSASFSYFSADLLQAFINDSMIPPSSPVRLNTTSLGPFIPQLPKMFPDLLMTLQIYATNFPVFSFRSGAVVLSSSGAVKAFAIQRNATLTPLFKLHVVSARFFVAFTGIKVLLLKLATGFALPHTKHAQLVNPVLTVEEGFVAFNSDAMLLEDTIFN
uniref:Bactericidal permeability-increasing protein n=1 Tax=Hippocampus comes TaxID=109280 RepID=A0A3Q2YJ56_HIPCM